MKLLSLICGYREAKSRALPNCQKIVLNRMPVILDLLVKLKYQSSTIILSVGIKYSWWPQKLCL